MNKKIGLGIILILAIVLVGLVWLILNKTPKITPASKQTNTNNSVVTNKQVSPQQANQKQTIAVNISPKDLINKEIEKYPLLKKSFLDDSPGLCWKNNAGVSYCFTSNSEPSGNVYGNYFAEIKSKVVVDELIKEVVTDLRQYGFVDNVKNSEVSVKKEIDSEIIAIEKDILKCSITKKQYSVGITDPSETTYDLIFSCAEIKNSDMN
ncbi:MAG: hypothetical protein ACD_8C00099G0001 [uncultured bacterium]|nr:MAG: hypothetical protein ACD_8C00099G0001 [uncultured bacterium]